MISDSYRYQLIVKAVISISCWQCTDSIGAALIPTQFLSV